jgi:ribose transport system ATP-binding protein
MTAPALAVRGMSKSFGGEHALRGVDLSVAPGEIHGLLGENGSGKSTLIKILAGYHAPDAGELEVNGRAIALPLAPGQFRTLGLEFVHQDLGLVPSMSVAENLFIGDIVGGRNRWYLSPARQRARGRRIFSRYRLDIDSGAIVSELKPLERAMLAIVRAVESFRALDGEGDGHGVLILDEPTVFLPKDGTGLLFALLRDIAQSGASVVLVSHKLREVQEVTDRVTVLRDGRVVGNVVTREADHATLVRMIVGHDIVMNRSQSSLKQTTGALVALDGVEGVRLAPTSFDISPGEIVGITGLVGSGFEELPQLLSGALAGQGDLVIGDTRHALSDHTPWRALSAGIALVPADRQRDGGVLSLTIEENLTLPILSRYLQGPILRRDRMRADARATLGTFAVHPAEPTLDYSSLSGGNQQKVILAKWLQIEPRLLLLHEPTQGVDVGAREQIHALVRQAAERGMAVLCASSDYEQLALHCDRVFIVGNGEVVDELTGSEITEDLIAERCYASAALDDVRIAVSEPGGEG